MVKKGTFSLTLGEMDHFSVPHAAGYMLHNGVKQILQAQQYINLMFSHDFLKQSSILFWSANTFESQDFKQARKPYHSHGWEILPRNSSECRHDIHQCKLVVSIKKWVDINEYKYVCIKLVHACWEN